MIESAREDTSSPSATEHGGRDGGRDAPHLRHWFPVAFEVDLDPTALTRVTVHGYGYVLFRGPEGRLACLPDRCPHRSARLSDGRRTRAGTVECLYHGWGFSGDGRCTGIPQLPSGVAIPPRAHLEPVPIEVVQGIVWIWPGRPTDADPAAIIRIDALDRADMRTIDYTSDLPYGQEALVENVLDFAHIHIAHDGARGGGHRAHAGPLAFEVEERGPAGFGAEFRSPTVDEAAQSERTEGARVDFDAPNLVHYVSTYADGERIAGLALFSVPLHHDRCRLVYRAYSNFWPRRDLKRPRWREHIHQMELLEQDMAVVMGQTQELAADERSLRDLWLPIKTSDQLVLQYRRWVETHATDTPGALGWRTRNDVAPSSHAPPALDRMTLHTQHCSACKAALASLERQRRAAGGAAFVATVSAAL
ncbi:MAG: Rieske 2Fe-2S domain-containing protein, partial [Planctomycetota bacterium]